MNDNNTAMMAAAEVPEGFDPRDEPMPFLSNFQDFFLSLGVIILLVGIGIFGGIITGNSGAGGTGLLTVGLGVTVAVLAIVWFLSEVLVRKRRRILPGIVLNIAYTGLVIGAFVLAYGLIFGEAAIEDVQNIDWADIGRGVDFEGEVEPTFDQVRTAANEASAALPWTVKGFILGLPLVSLLAAFTYYRRFKLPFAAAMVGAGVVGAVLAPLFVAFPVDMVRFSPLIQFLSGLALLVGGVAYDMKDPERVSRFSGNGFWLHLFAAPLMLGGALTMAAIGPYIDFEAMASGAYDGRNPFSVGQSIVTLVIIGVFAIVSLLLNRRALVVSGLISAGIAIGVIVRSTGIGGAGVAATTLVALGAAILLLGIGWHAARRAVLVFVPSGGVWDRIFPRNETDG